MFVYDTTSQIEFAHQIEWNFDMFLYNLFCLSVRMHLAKVGAGIR